MTALFWGSLTIVTAIVSSADMPVVGQTIKPAGINLPRPDKTTAIVPEAIARKLFQQIAKETNQSPNQLTISAVKSDEFNGCLGIYERPSQVCTANLIYGWKVIVQSYTKGKPQNLVYHLDRNGTRMIKNKTASGAKSDVYVSFIPFGKITPIRSNIIFSSSSAINQMTRTELTEDGKITIFQGKAKPIVIKTLSPAEINAFKTELETQRFPNFNGIYYLDSSSKADIRLTTNYQTQYVSTQVMNNQEKKLPPSLQRIILDWETLIQPTNPKLIKLQQLLQEKKWAAADQETRQLLQDLRTVPNSLIQGIDRAWLTASNNRFGLSVQSKIWRESVAKYPKDNQAVTNAFRDRVGWKLTQPRKEMDFISSDWLNESEINYSATAPIGHLPWAGISDASVYDLLQEVVNGCGSCTIDAMQLRNERFYIYMPTLFDRVRIALPIMPKS